MSLSKRWGGRVALVTGASSGIGAAIARRLAGGGMRVAICARRVDRLRQLAAEGGGEVLPLEVDLRDEGQILAAYASIREQWGGVDVLVNNAGLGRKTPLGSGETERWREMLDVNVLALAICTREALTDMRRRDVAGHIVHVSSMAGHRVPPNSGMYSATKFAVRSLTEGLRQELRATGSPVRVSAVSPGYVETEFHTGFHGDAANARAAYADFEVLKPEDVADAVEYVLSAPAHVQVHDVLMRPTGQPG